MYAANSRRIRYLDMLASIFVDVLGTHTDESYKNLRISDRIERENPLMVNPDKLKSQVNKKLEYLSITDELISKLLDFFRDKVDGINIHTPWEKEIKNWSKNQSDVSIYHA